MWLFIGCVVYCTGSMLVAQLAAPYYGGSHRMSLGSTARGVPDLWYSHWLLGPCPTMVPVVNKGLISSPFIGFPGQHGHCSMWRATWRKGVSSCPWRFIPTMECPAWGMHAASCCVFAHNCPFFAICCYFFLTFCLIFCLYCFYHAASSGSHTNSEGFPLSSPTRMYSF